jgi:dTDP-4-amino-4,6-dideoxygalactose transaminase
MTVKFNNLNAQWQVIKGKCLPAINGLFEKSDFILGDAVSEFEEMFASYVGCKYAVGVSNGTDALKLAAQSLAIQGSKTLFVIPANAFIATIMGIEQAAPNADYRLIDCNEYHQIDTIQLEWLLATERKDYDYVVIVPVHLYGYTCDMGKICELADRFDCAILEDASQAHGAKWKGRPVGSFGDVAAFSLCPGKNLGAAGDAGVITTDDRRAYIILQSLRNLGSRKKNEHNICGGNHRLDTIQAVILKEKMNYIDLWNEERRQVANQYEAKIKNKNIVLPSTPKWCEPVHYVYPVKADNRKRFTEYLDKNGVQWGVHYPRCIEETPMYRHLIRVGEDSNKLSGPNYRALQYSNEMVSLPIHPFMGPEVDIVCEVINEYK